MTVYLYYIVVAASSLILLIILYNFFTAPVVRRGRRIYGESPLVSVLIPARNEHQNIVQCLTAVMAQQYGTTEIIVLDDESTDATARMVESFSGIDKRITLIHGKPLPADWIGKNWACHQLSESAQGRYLLFLDADVRLRPEALSYAMDLLRRKAGEMLTVFPTQLMRSLGEWLVVPLMNWLLLTFLPLKKVYSSPRRAFVAANGQFLLIERKLYDRIGGHQAVRDSIVEDMAIARRVKAAGSRLITALGGRYVHCHMYDGFPGSFKGFTKNYYPGFRLNPAVFLAMVIGIGALMLAPFGFVLTGHQALTPLLLVLAGRALISVRSGQNILINVILHPFQMVVMIILGFNSVIAYKTKRIEWKNRQITSGST